jgi:hypothetical protein
VYDHLLTLDTEVEHVWKAPWTLPKYLFLTLRYFVLTTMIVNAFREYSPAVFLSFHTNFFLLQKYVLSLAKTFCLMYVCHSHLSPQTFPDAPLLVVLSPSTHQLSLIELPIVKYGLCYLRLLR